MTAERLSILVVEDSSVQSRIISGMLTACGCMVWTAARELDALSADARKTPTDAVFLDLQLADANGLDLIRPIRLAWPKAVIVAMTANSRDDFGALAQARKLGVDLVLSKPFQEPEARQVLEDVRAIRATGRRRPHVVVIDDSVGVRKVVAGYLEARQMRATVAARPEEMMRRLNYDHVDIVITDLVMPEMSGGEIIRLVRDVWPDVPVIAMSGDGGLTNSGGRLAEARRLGAAAIISKPFNESQLASVIETILPRAPVVSARARADEFVIDS